MHIYTTENFVFTHAFPPNAYCAVVFVHGKVYIIVRAHSAEKRTAVSNDADVDLLLSPMQKLIYVSVLTNIITPVGNHFPGCLRPLLSFIFNEVIEEYGLSAYKIFLKV